MTRIAALIVFVGVALIVSGLVSVFGAWALVVAGVVLVAAGLLVDWEKAT